MASWDHAYCLILRKFASRQSAKDETFPLPFKGKQAENRSHNLGKALGEVLGHKFSYRRKDIKKERRKDGVSLWDVEELTFLIIFLVYYQIEYFTNIAIVLPFRS